MLPYYSQTVSTMATATCDLRAAALLLYEAITGGGGAPDLRPPSQRWKAPPPGTPFPHPHSEQRRPARAHAVEPVLGPHARTDRTRNTRVAVPRLPVPENGRSGEGQRLTPNAPYNDGRPTPPGDGPQPPARQAAPTGRAGQGDSVGPPHPHTRAHSTWVADPDSPASRRAVGGGGAPDFRHPSQRWRAPPPGTLFRHPHSEQRRPARANAVGPVPGPHARTDRTRDTRVAGPQPPGPEDGQQGGGQRLTPDAPRNGGRPPPRHAAPTEHAGQRGSNGPPRPHARAHSMWVTDPNSPPSGAAVGGGGAPNLRRLSQQWKATPPGDALPPTPQRATTARKGARCGTSAGSPPPHRPHPEHTGRGTPAARSRGRAVGRGTAPDNRRLSQQWQPPPPPGTAPHQPRGTQPPQGVQAKPGREEPGPDAPPPRARQREQGTGAGHAEGHGPRGTALPAPSAWTTRGAHATPPRGGGADAPGARGHTHAKGTRGLPEGQPDRARGTHRLRGMAYQRVRVRDTRTGRPATRSAGHAGREGGNGRDTTPSTGPSPLEPAASAPHTWTGHCTRQGSSGALRHAPTPRQGSLCPSPRQSHWRQASSTGPAAPAPRATTH